MSCASVYIAPTILACPAKVDLNDEFKDELEHYIVQLTDLRDSIGSNLFQILASRNTGDLLIEAGCYPVFPSIRKGLAESGLDEIYQTGDVVKIIEQILRDSDVVEDFIGVTDILTDSVTVSGSIRYIAAPELVEQQKINKTMLALGDHLGILSSDKTWIIGKLEEEGAIHEENYLEIKARIADIE